MRRFTRGDRVRTLTEGELGGWSTWPPPHPIEWTATVAPGATGVVLVADGLAKGWIVVKFDGHDGDVFALVDPKVVKAMTS